MCEQLRVMIIFGRNVLYFVEKKVGAPVYAGTVEGVTKAKKEKELQKGLLKPRKW